MARSLVIQRFRSSSAAAGLALLPLATIVLASGCDSETKAGKLQTQANATMAAVDTPSQPPTPEETAEARKRADWAIEAHGGATRLARIKGVIETLDGTVGAVPNDLLSKGEMHIQFPDRVRLKLDQDTPVGKVQVSIALAGSVGWEAKGPEVSDMSPTQVPDVLTDLYIQRLAIVMPLKEESTQLWPLPEISVNNRRAVGIRVKPAKKPALEMYFDKETGHHIRTVALVHEASMPVRRDILYLGHKEFDGVWLPTRLLELRDGTKFVEWLSISYQFVDQIDEKLLKRPQ
ncbi:MAG: hypothetical protein ACJ8F7_17735 [Gemmataceae bacterium]